MVAFSRVVVGAHWPADVLAGLGLGIWIAWLAQRWEWWWSWTPYLSARSGEGLELLRGVLATIAQETDKIRRLENFEVTQAEVGEQFDVLADRPVSADYLLSFNDARLGYLPRDI